MFVKTSGLMAFIEFGALTKGSCMSQSLNDSHTSAKKLEHTPVPAAVGDLELDNEGNLKVDNATKRFFFFLDFTVLPKQLSDGGF